LRRQHQKEYTSTPVDELQHQMMEHYTVSVQFHWARSNVCNSDSDQVTRTFPNPTLNLTHTFDQAQWNCTNTLYSTAEKIPEKAKATTY